MLSFVFKKLYNDLEVRVKVENKTDSSWLMGYVQGLGKKKLTGYQFAALVDLLLVHPAAPEVPKPTDVPKVSVSDAQVPISGEEPATAGTRKLTLAQR